MLYVSRTSFTISSLDFLCELHKKFQRHVVKCFEVSALYYFHSILKFNALPKSLMMQAKRR